MTKKNSIIRVLLLLYFCNFLCKAMERELYWQGVNWKQEFIALKEKDESQPFFDTVSRCNRFFGLSDDHVQPITEKDLWYNPARNKELVKLIQKSSNRSAILCASAHSGFARGIRLALKCGAKINGWPMTIAYKSTPLYYAVDGQHMEAVKLLLDCGADINGRNERLETPLHRAVEDGCIEMVRFLLDHGAHINASDKRYETPLHYAITKENMPIIQLLLSRGANVWAPNKHNKTPIDFANKCTDPAIKKLFMPYNTCRCTIL